MAIPAERVYSSLVQVDEDHGCGDLPEHVCREVPGNALRIVVAQTLQSIGDKVVDAKAVLPWLLVGVGAPAALVGLLVPIRESGSMLPQAALVPRIRRLAVRKWVWVAGGVGQAAAAAVMALAAATLRGVVAGMVVLAALAAFAVARALTSIASKDVLGRTVPKGQRGQVNGLATVASGAVGVTLGVGIAALGGDEPNPRALAALLAAAALVWVLACLVFATVREPAGERDAALDVGWLTHAVRLLRDDAPFRGFVVVRTLLLVSALSPPFIVMLAAEQPDHGLTVLGPFVIASGLASVLGGWVFGRLADRSSRSLMIAGAAVSSSVILVLLGVRASPALAALWWPYPLAYLLLTFAHIGVRVARKTYVVDLASDNRRTDYVAVSNTAMGVLLLLTGVISGALAQIGVEVALALLATMGLLGALVGRTLPEVSAPAQRARRGGNRDRRRPGAGRPRPMLRHPSRVAARGRGEAT